jgi:putative transcriptional regulator
MTKPKVIETLEHHLLVAMPSITEELFSRSVLYIYEHDASGAMGFVINKPIPISMADILRQLSIEDIDIKAHEQFLLQGGPVSGEQLYILKEDEENPKQPYLVQPQELLDSFAQGKLLDTTLPVLGYAGWSAGQLENEIIKHNDWLICPVFPEILFDTPLEKRWEACLIRLGIDPNFLIGRTGNA